MSFSNKILSSVIIVLLVITSSVIGFYFGNYSKTAEEIKSVTQQEKNEISNVKVSFQDKEACPEENDPSYDKKNASVIDLMKESEVIDKETYKYLCNGYAKDGARVYYGYHIYGTPQEPSNESYLIKIIDGADPKTFKTIKDASGKVIFSSDAKKVFYEKQTCENIREVVAIDNADPESFTVVNTSFSKDKNHAYYNNFGSCAYGSFSVILLEKVDISTFVGLGHYLAKDKNYVYMFDGVIKGDVANSIDVKTFVSVDNDIYFKDKNFVYKIERYPQGEGYYLKVVKNIKPDNCSSNNLKGCEE